MKHFLRFFLACVVVMMAFAARAEEKKPYMVVACAGYDALMREIREIGRISGNPAMTSVMEVYFRQMFWLGTDWLDKASPMGVLVYREDVENAPEPYPDGLAYRSRMVVVFGAEEDALIGGITDYLQKVNPGMEFESDRREDGVVRIGRGEAAYIKRVGNCVYFSLWDDVFPVLGDSLPTERAEVFGGLEKKYSLGARVNLGMMTPEERLELVDEWAAYLLMFGIPILDRERESVQPDGRRTVAGPMGNADFKFLRRQLLHAESVEIGYVRNPETDALEVRVKVVLEKDSESAKLVADARQRKGKLGGVMDMTPMWGSYGWKLGESEPSYFGQAAHGYGMLRLWQTFFLAVPMMEERIGGASGLVAWIVFREVLDLADDFIEVGMLDDSRVGKPMTFYVATSKRPEAILEWFEEWIDTMDRREDMEVKKNYVEMNAETWDGFTFHRLRLPWDAGITPDSEEEEKTFAENMKKLYGDTLVVTVGMAEDRIFAGVGEEAVEMLKKIPKEAETDCLGKMSLSLGKIYRYGWGINEALAPPEHDWQKWVPAGEALKEGHDGVTVTITAADDAMVEYVFSMEKNVVRWIGTFSWWKMMAEHEFFREALDEGGFY